MGVLREQLAGGATTEVSGGMGSANRPSSAPASLPRQEAIVYQYRSPESRTRLQNLTEILHLLVHYGVVFVRKNSVVQPLLEMPRGPKLLS
jgi:hypothetical protein